VNEPPGVPLQPPSAADPPALLRRRRRRQLWITVPAVGLYLVVAVGRIALRRADWTLIAGLLVLVGVLLLVSRWIWRCPVCERYLGEELWPARCPHCGVPFEVR